MSSLIKKSLLITALAALPLAASENLLLNPAFAFHSFINHRDGKANSWSAQTVAFWQHENYGDITVTRESHLASGERPDYSVQNIVSIAPGKRFSQFIPFAEAGLAHNQVVSLWSGGWQSAPGALQASLKLMKIDSEDGTWKPADFGASDQREFPRHSRGELVVAKTASASADSAGMLELRIEDFLLEGRYHSDGKSYSEDCNSIGLVVEFTNLSPDARVNVWAPCLSQGPSASAFLPARRQMPSAYRHIPRTLQKLWKGEPIHILLMGSSIDRGSANPPMYCYDEDPASPTFKQPKLPDRQFDPALVNRPDLAGYVGWWQHYYSYAGRLRLELMRRFNLPVEKICLNFMACDGSCIGESHSGLEAYCSLSLPPSPGVNGYADGGDWQKLHPELFSRSSGPGPDLVIYGSGANEKTDTPDEGAVFEGAIRWIQSHYPQAEFLFCLFQNYGGYTPSPGDLQAIALRYQIPFMDYGKLGDDTVRWCSRQALVPSDGHPQAASHFLWFHALRQAFECWDPIQPGQVQLQLPERMHVNTLNWEGEMITYQSPHERIKGNKFLLDDCAFNLWAGAKRDTVPEGYVNGGRFGGMRKNSSSVWNHRNSAARWGRGQLGDRQLVEIGGEEIQIGAVDMKQIPNRRYFGIENQQWQCSSTISDFASEFGAPYGNRQAILEPGAKATLWAVGTDFSLAYVDTMDGGEMLIRIDGQEKLRLPTNQPFFTIEQQLVFLENRRGIRNLGYGLHQIEVEALDGPVALLGAYSYDSRPNRSTERQYSGLASPGETVRFSRPFKTRPLVVCQGGLAVSWQDISATQVTFSGSGSGTFSVIGE
ncbi:MAG: hypothetical protein GX564_05185 [Oligosphaeraceae bacterium]|nr:hypothetical protein [Oligosphaeraceae bacterium]